MTVTNHICLCTKATRIYGLDNWKEIAVSVDGVHDIATINFAYFHLDTTDTKV